MSNLEKVYQFAKEHSIHLYEPRKRSEDKVWHRYYKKNEAYRTAVDCIGVTRNNMELIKINEEFPNITRLDNRTTHIYDLYIVE